MTTSTYCLSLVWVSMVLMSPYTVSSESMGALINAWLSKCFVEGFVGVDSTVTNCTAIKLNRELFNVTETVPKCTEYFKLGCHLGRANFICQDGISHATTNSSCSDVQIDGDHANLGFACCVSCLSGLSHSITEGKCDEIKSLELGDIAHNRCCKNALNTLENPEVDVEPSSLPPIGNFTFDEISALVSDNDDKINESMNKKMLTTDSGGTESTTKSTELESVGGLSSPLPESLSIPSSTPDSGESVAKSVEPSSSLPPILSTASVNESSSTENPSTEPPVAEPRAACKQGYQRSNPLKECEDVNECEEDEGKCRRTEKCFNLQGSHRCCPLGTEVPDEESECTYIDHCVKSPCFQSETDQHYCINYFTGRLCEDKLVEGYTFVEGNEGIMELINKSDSSLPRYLELTQKEVTLKGDLFDRLGLINVKMLESADCDWDFHLKTYAPSAGDQLQQDQFIQKWTPNVFKVWLTGQVRPQSAVIDVTCNIRGKKFYQNTIYFTFNPESKIVRNGDSD